MDQKALAAAWGALVFIAAAATVAHLVEWPPHLSSETWAAWAQAFGTIAAVFIAANLGAIQTDRRTKRTRLAMLLEAQTSAKLVDMALRDAFEAPKDRYRISMSHARVAAVARQAASIPRFEASSGSVQAAVFGMVANIAEAEAILASARISGLDAYSITLLNGVARKILSLAVVIDNRAGAIVHKPIDEPWA